MKYPKNHSRRLTRTDRNKKAFPPPDDHCKHCRVAEKPTASPSPTNTTHHFHQLEHCYPTTITALLSDSRILFTGDRNKSLCLSEADYAVVDIDLEIEI